MHNQLTYRFWWLGFFLALFANASLRGQTALFQTQTLPMGLQAKRLCQDAQNYVWVGGETGLYRYDGYEYEAVELPDSLAQTEISALLVDSQNHLLVGFANGQLLQYSLEMKLKLLSRTQVADAAIRDISICAGNQIWVATAGDGLWYYSEKNDLWQQIEGLPDDYLYTLINGPELRMWAGTDRGVVVVDPISHELVNIASLDKAFKDEIIQALLPLPNGDICIGTYDGGLARYDQAFHAVVKLDLPDFGPIKNLEASDNGIWIGTERKGLYWLDFNWQLQKLTTSARLRILDILYDREGNLWTLDQQHGLRIAPAAFSFLPLESGVQAIYAGQKDVWYATDQGVARYDLETFEQTTLDLPLRGRVLSLFQDSQDYLWIGTQGDGVWHVNPDRKTWQHITEEDGLISNHILSISEGADSLWFATFGGVASCKVSKDVDPKAFRLFNKADGLGVNYIYQAFIDSKERLWFATDGKGVRLRQEQQFQAIKGSDRKTILGIAEDNEANLWFHAQDEGIWKLKGDSITAFDLPISLQNQSFSTLNTDKFGRLLIGGENGLSIYDPASKNMWRLDQRHDFPALGAFLNLMSTCPSGKVWIGTEEGLIRYDPQLLPVNQTIKAQIKSIAVLLEEVEVEEGTMFGAEENHLSFHYAAPWFQNQDMIGFEHRLLGLDLDWIQSRNREVIYPRLAPGKYTFELRASNQATLEQAPISRFSFQIKRPLWQSWWFGVLIGLGLIGGTLAWIRLRENRLRRTEGLERAYLSAQFETLKSQINPHFLFNSFNTLAAIIEEQPKEAVAYVEHLSDLFRNILEYRKQTKISIGEELDLLDKFYYLQSHRYHENFVLHVNVDEKTRSMGIPPMSLQLLVENALKHNVVSKRQPLAVYIETTRPAYLSVRNSLQLRRDHRPSTKIGQQNIRQRYQLLGKESVEIEITDQFYCVHLPLLTSPEQ
ncbi:MAG: two-component regulator propeller domain-containing protein [Bacteroidota bacterium]